MERNKNAPELCDANCAETPEEWRCELNLLLAGAGPKREATLSDFAGLAMKAMRNAVSSRGEKEDNCAARSWAACAIEALLAGLAAGWPPADEDETAGWDADFSALRAGEGRSLDDWADLGAGALSFAQARFAQDGKDPAGAPLMARASLALALGIAFPPGGQE